MSKKVQVSLSKQDQKILQEIIDKVDGVNDSEAAIRWSLDVVRQIIGLLNPGPMPASFVNTDEHTHTGILADWRKNRYTVRPTRSNINYPMNFDITGIPPGQTTSSADDPLDPPNETGPWIKPGPDL